MLLCVLPNNVYDSPEDNSIVSRSIQRMEYLLFAAYQEIVLLSSRPTIIVPIVQLVGHVDGQDFYIFGLLQS